MNEKELTKAVIDLLQACGWYVIRTHRPGQFATQPGVSDLITVHTNGTVAFIELKGPKTEITKKQELFLAEMKYRGHIAFIASDLKTVKKQLDLPVLL